MNETEPDIIARAKGLLEHDTDAAERLFEEAIARQPDNHDAYVQLFNARMRRSDFSGAESVMDDALARSPETPGLLTLRATARGKLGRLEEAIADLDQAHARTPTRHRALLLGHFHHALGAPERALPLYLRALALGAAEDEGKRAQIWALMRRALLDLGRSLATDATEACWRLYRQRPAWVASSIERATNQNDFWEWDAVRRKDGLAHVLAAAGPGAAPRHPATYILPQDASRLAADAKAGRCGPIWIVKPLDLFGGQGIRLIDDVSRIPRGRPLLVQHYVDPPFLLGGCKQHLRCYVMFTSSDPLRAWFWRDGLVRFAPEPYQRGPDWLSRADMHVTNTALHRGHPGIRFNPDASVEADGSVWGLAAFVERVGGDAAGREALWQSLEDVARKLVAAIGRSGLFERQGEAGRAYQPKLIGFDAVLDADMAPWLSEVQRDPGQTGSGPVNRISARLFRTMFEMTTPQVGSNEPKAILVAERAAEEARRGAFVKL